MANMKTTHFGRQISQITSQLLDRVLINNYNVHIQPVKSLVRIEKCYTLYIEILENNIITYIKIKCDSNPTIYWKKFYEIY